VKAEASRENIKQTQGATRDAHGGAREPYASAARALARLPFAGNPASGRRTSAVTETGPGRTERYVFDRRAR
jgi:hypothetical protein